MKKISSIFFIIFCIFCFWKTWESNYEKQKEIKKNIVNHPEFLPTKTYALNTSFGFKNQKADYYWLQTIQYIWGNAVSSEYKKYLFEMIDLITELNPYFSQPYITWELLLPSYNPRYEDLTEQEQENLKLQAKDIWLKWLKNFCDLEKIDLIGKEDNLEKLFSEKKCQNPCKEAEIVYNLAFIYYFYLKDYKNAVKYYKVASVTKGSPAWAKNLISILEGKWWNREKAFFMFLNMADYTGKNDEICTEFSKTLKNFWNDIFSRKVALNWKVLSFLDSERKKYFSENNNWFEASNCSNFINKSIRELNIYFLDEANKKYFSENKKFALSPEELLTAWFIDYIPTDYQKNNDYWIIYFYNSEINWFDYKMW